MYVQYSVVRKPRDKYQNTSGSHFSAHQNKDISLIILPMLQLVPRVLCKAFRRNYAVYSILRLRNRRQDTYLILYNLISVKIILALNYAKRSDYILDH